MLSVWSVVLFGLFCTISAAAESEPLKAYNVDPHTVSISGLSSGGYMAGQLGVAYSSVFAVGFGVFAAGPFDCARNQSLSYCVYNQTAPSISTPLHNMRAWSGNQIDTLANLKRRKIYMQIGTADMTVGEKPMEQLRAQLSYFDDPSKVSYVVNKGASHTFPTDFDGPGNSPCDTSVSPFISNCGYDGAGSVLQWMYGCLRPRNNGELRGSVVSFDQTGKFGADGMGPAAYLYVPKPCQKHARCRLHVALHGCRQSPPFINQTFVHNTGYNKWADSNNIIILYPQTTIDNNVHLTWNGDLRNNERSCWDWNGWYGNNADQKGGVQMAAIVNQVKRITTGHRAW